MESEIIELTSIKNGARWNGLVENFDTTFKIYTTITVQNSNGGPVGKCSNILYSNLPIVICELFVEMI